jgi:hypothetical protein
MAVQRTITVPHWADVLALRPEVTSSDGSVGELQMSLHKAVYQTVDVPYREVSYYADITQPTPNLIGFLGRVARRLGTTADSTALFHLDQGMGGGKSHALVGLYHMTAHPQEFFATDLGSQVQREANSGGPAVDLTRTRVVTLCADHFSPGKPTENFGPATTLFERFLWGLIGGDRRRYDRYAAMGVNKQTLQNALTDAGRPVLILLDELMDYAQLLTDKSAIDTLPGEQAFLNALMDACDDVPQVAFVVVMIKSDLDERGYHFKAQEFRDYISQRLVRNGTTVPVTEAQDFSAIIRRRLFETAAAPIPAADLAAAYAVADARWRAQVLDKLGGNRGPDGLATRIDGSYPFHPDLMRLVQDEWSQVTGFQRVRSTVAIFARTALYWVNEHHNGRWAPALVGVGDVPLTVALEPVLSSGLLLGNDRSIQGYRAVASTDITSGDGSNGRAVTIDGQLHEAGVDAGQPAPAVRMATALFCYSLVARPQGRRGAIKPELLAALLEPAAGAEGTPFPAAEEVFNALTAEDVGLGSLEKLTPTSGPIRYWLTIKQTLRMYHNAAQQLVQPWERDELIWKVIHEATTKGYFDRVALVEAPKTQDHELAAAPLEEVFRSVDADETRLVILDPSRWTLLNGRDEATRTDIMSLFSLGPDPLRVDNAASCVIACIGTYQRDHARRRAASALAWRRVIPQLPPDDLDEIREARGLLREEERKLRQALLAAFQHYAYISRSGNDIVSEFKRFDDDKQSALRGEDVWASLVANARATMPDGLSETYLSTLLDRFDRQLTLREVRQAFYKNPDFPLVPSVDEIRRAVFKLLQLGWEIVDSEGQRAGITSAEQIPINSMNQVLQRVETAPPSAGSGPPPAAGPDGATAGEPEQPSPSAPRPDAGWAPASPQPPPPSAPGGTVTYKRYRARLDNLSVARPEARGQAWKLLSELARLLDPAREDFDHQLINIDLTLTTADGHTADLETRVRDAGGRLDVEDDDF